MATPSAVSRPFALLCLGQACVWSTLFLGVFLGPFAAREMTGGFALSGLPFAMFFLANLLVLVPAGWLMDRIGRAPVLALGHLAGAGGASSVAAGLIARAVGSVLAIPAFLAGLFLLGAGSSIALLTRVPVTDLYSPESRPKALGRLILISFLGSLLGASIFFLLGIGGSVPVAFGYLAMVPLFGLGAASMFTCGRFMPGSSAAAAARGTRLRTLVARPGVGWTITGGTGGYAGMVGVMSLASAALAPLGVAATGAIMLGHFGGMFLPSPLAGRLVAYRTRALGIAAGGLVLGLGALLFVRTDLALVAGIGLFCIGAGWCFTFIPSTAILADATRFEERGTLFGGNDAIVAVAGVATTILAGLAFNAWGATGVVSIALVCALAPLAAGAALSRDRFAKASPGEPTADR